MKKKAIIVGNGLKPSKSIIDLLKNNGFNDIICADGGANNLYKLKINPLYIIGDLDSIKPEVYEYYKEIVKGIIKIDDQNNTDVEKCLDFLIKRNYNEVILIGVTGNRLDHIMGNLSIAYKYADKIRMNIIHYSCLLTCFNESFKLKTKVGETISIYSFRMQNKITVSGLKYKIDNEHITFGLKEGTSNEAIADEISVFMSDKIFLIRKLSNAVNNDFFK